MFHETAKVFPCILDDINVLDEETIFNAVMQWVCYDVQINAHFINVYIFNFNTIGLVSFVFLNLLRVMRNSSGMGNLPFIQEFSERFTNKAGTIISFDLIWQAKNGEALEKMVYGMFIFFSHIGCSPTSMGEVCDPAAATGTPHT
ncbi:Kelch-like protein 4 [Manis javanica]|nr:Kelch-like protein 4 [Manis javanica]